MDSKEQTMAVKYEYINNCLACGSDKLFKFLDLGKQPLANSYVKTLWEVQEYYPLGLQYCENCSHVQLTVKVDPDELFKNYLYVSGTSNTGRKHFREFANLTEQYVSKITNVLDIACNDGSQLEVYKDRGYKTYGIDPAQNLLELSSKQGNIICDYLTKDNIKSFGVKFDIIIAQNVFAHLDYTKEFLEYAASCLSEDGAIFIQTSQANMIFNAEFDTAYHEHLSFFSPESMLALARRAGLCLTDVKFADIHGTSFIFVLRQSGQEIDLNAFNRVTRETVTKFAAKSLAISAATRAAITKLRDNGFAIVGYGAAAKSSTFLNLSKISLDYIVEDNPLKCGLYTPGTKIPIVGTDVLKNDIHRKLIVIPLAWNFYDEIKERALSLNKDITLMKYYPVLHIE